MSKKTLYRKAILTFVLFLLVCGTLPANAHDTFEPRSMINFREFPTDPALFSDDMRPYVSQIIAKHGLEEWKAVVLTNELHHHMGLWSIVGAKMGVRAREVLIATFDGIDVSSSAGIKPPFSCLNDGLQVATGASLGRGTIKVSDVNQPVVEFTANGKKVTMKVKQEIVQEVGRVIKECSDKYVFQSPQYFRELDKISVLYWLKWDRSELFDEKIAP
jgi:pyrimidine-specific ribonucleoside hydrolase